MIQPPHASADLLADLLAGSLSAEEAISVNAHVSGCADCADLRDALADVSALLQAEGAVSWEMPADVATALDGALAAASAERAANIQSIDPVRRPRRTGALRWLAGAAAAVVVASAGVAGWQAIPRSNDGATSSAGGAPADSYAGPESLTPGLPAGHKPPPMFGGPGRVILPLTAGQVPVEARRLVAHAFEVALPRSVGCARPIGGGLSTVVRWQGDYAILNARPATRTATVLDCRTAVETLYTTGF